MIIRKILMLDVDGVLNNHAILRAQPTNGVFVELGDDLLALLKRIVDQTKCEIVLRSTWRLRKDNTMKLRRAFHKIGIDHKFRVTPNLNAHKRRFEIEQWIRDNLFEKAAIVVVLDDDRSAEIQEEFPNVITQFVGTNAYEGLTERAFNEVIAAFGG